MTTTTTQCKLQCVPIYSLVLHVSKCDSAPRKNTIMQWKLQQVVTTMTESGLCLLVDGRKIPPAQVAQCQQLYEQDAATKCSLHKGTTLINCRSCNCPCATCIWLLHPTPILVPKMVLTLCKLQKSFLSNIHSNNSTCDARCFNPKVFVNCEVQGTSCITC